jgi:cytochrome c556
MSRVARLVLAVAVGMLVAACGSDAAAERDEPKRDRAQRYEAMVRTIHSDMNDAMGAAFASSTLDAERVRAAKETAQQAVTEMESANTPDRYARAHEQYLQGLETFAAILGDVEQQVDDPNVARRHLEDERFSSGVQHLEQATQMYADAGLDLDDDATTGR